MRITQPSSGGSGSPTVVKRSNEIDKPINPNAIWGVNAANPLTTPTYDGTGQATHCDVVQFQSPWNGYRYWMAFTPFANSNDGLENPCILASNDGITWVVPTGLTNPLEPKPGVGDYNSDTDMIYNPKDNKLYVFWRMRKQVDDGSGRYDRIYYKSSSDGVNWSDKQEFMTFRSEWCLSPAFVYDEDNDNYHMWYVSSDPIPATTIDPYTDGTTTITALTVKKMTSSNLTSGWSSPQITNLAGNFLYGNTHVWHVDCIKVGGYYHMLINSKNKDLYVAVSKDGIKWEYPTTPTLEKSAGSVWDNGLYRSSMTFQGNGIEYKYKLWYSGLLGSTWRIGYTDLYVTKSDISRYNVNPKTKQAVVGINSSDRGIIQVGKNSQDSSGEYSVSRFGDESSPLALWDMKALLMRSYGDLEMTRAANGLIQRSPDGTKWRMGVDNLGVTVWKKILNGDDFRKANSATSVGTADNAAAWVNYGGAIFGIDNNQVYNVNATNNGFTAYDTGQTNCRITSRIANALGDFGIVFRVTDASNYWRCIRSSGTLYLQKFVAGTRTDVATGSISVANGDVLSVEINGDQISCYFNGVQIISPRTDAFNQTSTKHGIGNGTGNAATRWDNIRIEVL